MARTGAARRILAAVTLVLFTGTACAAPGPGTPGINVLTPLPSFSAVTSTPLAPATPPTAASIPATATVASTTPLEATTALPTPDHRLPQMVLTPTQGSAVHLYIEIADTPAKQETGLMHRTAMAEDAGMLFVFPSETTVSFWMKDTLLPLSIAFLSRDGHILDLQDMAPLDQSLHTPPQAYLYALEVNQGYFRRHGLVAGDRTLLPALPPTPTAPALSPTPNPAP